MFGSKVSAGGAKGMPQSMHESASMEKKKTNVGKKAQLLLLSLEKNVFLGLV